MKMKISVLSLAGLAIACSAHAQNSTGNGGNARVCFSDAAIAERLTIPGAAVSNVIPDSLMDKIESVELLDLVEARMPDGYGTTVKPLVAEQLDETPEQLAERIVDAFSFFIPDDQSAKTFTRLKEIYWNGARNIRQFRVPREGGIFGANDISPLIKARVGCVYATIAVQQDIGAGNRKLVIDGRVPFVDQKIHAKLSQAALLMHEYFLSAELSRRPDSKSAISTEPIRELVSALIRRGTTVDEVLEIIYRRNLFGLAPLAKHDSARGVYFPKVNEIVAQMVDEFSRKEMGVKNDLAEEFREFTHVEFEKLPRRYQHLNRSYGLWEPLPERFRKFLVAEGNQYGYKHVDEEGKLILNRIENMREDFIQTRVREAVLKKLEEGKAKRLEDVKRALSEDLSQMGTIDVREIEHLSAGLVDFAIAGKAQYHSDFGLYEISAGKDVYITLSPKIIRPFLMF